jgi:phosphoglycerate dehydrogenase-like enzyme
MTRVTIASQFGDDFDQKLRAARPDVEVIALPRVLTWPLPAKADILLAIPVSAQVRAQPQPEGWPFGLRWVQLISVGLNNYPPWLLRGPLVTTAHGTSSQTIADFALACVLQHALRLSDRRVRSPEGWRHVSAPALAGSTLGLFGFGGIGRALAAKALALGLRVRALRASRVPLGMDGVEAARDLADLLATSDHLALVAPGTDATRHVINAASLAHARPGLHLIKRLAWQPGRTDRPGGGARFRAAGLRIAGCDRTRTAAGGPCSVHASAGVSQFAHLRDQPAGACGGAREVSAWPGHLGKRRYPG